MEFLENFPGHKVLAGILLALIIVIEIQRGFLKPFPAHCRHSSNPFRFPMSLAAVAVISALGILPFDSWIIAKVQLIKNENVLQIIKFGAFWGRSQNTWVILAILYFGAWIIRHEVTRRIFWGALLSSALTGLITHILKFIFMRARPYNDLGPYHFFDVQGYMRDVRAFQSFPSGDVATAAGAAAFLFFAARKSGGAAFFAITILVMLSRMILDKHWPSDTVFSFWMGLAVAAFVWSYQQYEAAERG